MYNQWCVALQHQFVQASSSFIVQCILYGMARQGTKPTIFELAAAQLLHEAEAVLSVSVSAGGFW